MTRILSEKVPKQNNLHFLYYRKKEYAFDLLKQFSNFQALELFPCL
ncbi:MAG: DUF1106 domain-containing protein [Desulfobacteraceae bacterium]|nr:DUF1106 domain-containing protein [Desulfobacteraceae bacterium]MCB9495139.1 DUF1106 domain-containing protein [Desulfobacteraceae bacterium]